MNRSFRALWLGSMLSLLTPFAWAQEGDPEILALIQGLNEELHARGVHLSISEVHFMTSGEGKPSIRVIQTPTRWVPNDPRRTSGTDLTYVVDPTLGATASGLSAAETEAAIDRALETLDSDGCLNKLDLVKLSYGGVATGIAGALLGYGDPVAASFLRPDIYMAGWYPAELFEELGNPGDSTHVIATTFVFTFYDPVTRTDTDINGDNYWDVAGVEIYFNDNFGDPNGTQPERPWGIDVTSPAIDAESIVLHEAGHALGLGHFGPPPVAVMNPSYKGIDQELHATDRAGICALFASWPNP